MNSASEPAVSTSLSAASAHRLFQAGSAILTFAAFAAFYFSPVTDTPKLIAGIAVLVLGCLPSLQWIRHSRSWFPCFEISMLTCVVFYGLPIINGYEDLTVYPNGVLLTSAFLVVAYLVAAILSFNLVKSNKSAPSWSIQPLLPEGMLRYMPLGIVINTIYTSFDNFGIALPANINGLVRALCFGLSTVSAFIISCRWGSGILPRQIKALFIVCIFLQLVFLFSQLYLISGISLLILCAIGYTTTSRTPPWIPILIVFPLIALLHNGKGQMRQIYWITPDSPIVPTVTELPSFFSQWISFGLSRQHEDAKLDLAQNLAQRASLFQMLTLVVNEVPDHQPYISGESYKDIPAQVVPRFLWPDRPSSLQSNERLAIYFHLVDADSVKSVSIAFGVLAEAYANFGTLGIIALGAITGFIFKHLALRSVGTPLFSAIGIFMILLTAWSFQAELIMVTWLTSLFQAAAVCIIAPLAYKKFFGGI